VPRIGLDGFFDLHVHSSPDLFPRIADDVGVVTDAARRGFAGLVLKNHFEPTVSRAALAQRQAPDVRVYGGVVLNRPVGGVNPSAVEAALKMGGKIVWMPTLDAECHRRAFGFGGGFPAQASGLERTAPGISVLRDGALLPEAREVIALAKAHGAAVATGHVALDEIRALVDEARDQGFRKLILTHPYDRAPGLSLADVQALAQAELRIEFVFCSITPRWAFTDAAAIARCIRTVGPEKVLLSSDGGQAHNPPPGEGYATFVEALAGEGVDPEAFRLMCRENPDFLLHG
jgi:hypothetical protein